MTTTTEEAIHHVDRISEAASETCIPEEECNCDQALSLQIQLWREKWNAKTARTALELMLEINKSGKRAPPYLLALVDKALNP